MSNQRIPYADKDAPCDRCGEHGHDDRAHRMVHRDDLLAFTLWSVGRGWSTRPHAEQSYEVLQLERETGDRWAVCVFYRRNDSEFLTARGRDAKHVARQWCQAKFKE